MKKICCVIPSLSAGGMERVMSELINFFSSTGKYEIHLILYGIKREIFYDIDNKIIIHKPAFQFNNNFRFYNTIKTILFLRREIKKIKPSTVLSFGEIWNNFVLLSTLGLKFHIYVSDRCNPEKKLSFTQEALRKYLYRQAAGIIVQTKKAENIYKLLIKNKNIIAIGNPIREINDRADIFKENLVLTVGRLIETKHHEQLIKIFINAAPLDWKLMIVGDDAEKQNVRSKLERLIKELNVKERVVLTGTRKDVDELYLKSKIFAFTSSSEGFPNVIGEAHSAGLPVVAYNCVAGPSELIEDGVNGFLIPLFDTNKFEEKLKLLIKEEYLRNRMGMIGRKTIKKYSVGNISRQFENFIFKK